MPQWAVLGWPGHIWANLFGGVVTNRENKIGSGSFRTKLLPALAAEAPGGDMCVLELRERSGTHSS